MPRRVPLRVNRLIKERINMAKAKRPDKERLKELLRKGMSPLGPPKKKAMPKKKKKKLSWVDKLKAKVKEHFARERRSRQNVRDAAIARSLRVGGATDEDIKKLGYGKEK